MKIIYVSLALASMLLFSGCMSSATLAKLEEDRDHRVLFSTVPFYPIEGQTKKVILLSDIEFKADTSALDKNIPYKLKAGSYVLAFQNEDGGFYRGENGCVTSKGVWGMNNMAGGFFVPKDEARRIMIWSTDTGGYFAIPAGGSLVFLGSGPNPKNARWIIALPRELNNELLALVKKEANQVPEPTATAVTDSAAQSPRQP
jgi:hypothetical protein